MELVRNRKIPYNEGQSKSIYNCLSKYEIFLYNRYIGIIGRKISHDRDETTDERKFINV